MKKKFILFEAIDEIKEHIVWDETKEEIKQELRDWDKEQAFYKFVGWCMILSFFAWIAIKF